MVINITSQLVWATRKVYFSNGFFQDTLREEVYVEMPVMFSENNENSEETVVIKLGKSLYGLVHAPHTWYQHLQKGINSIKFEPYNLDKAMYYRQGMIITTYGDD